MFLVLLAAIGIILLVFISGLYVFIIGFVRQKDLSWLVESEVRKTPFAQFYPQISEANQWIRMHNTYGVTVQSNDGLKLHGLWIPAKNPKGTILLAHGYRSHYLVDFGPALSQYHDMGLNMLIPEQRAHGESEGNLITFGAKESSDIAQWVKYHNQSYGEIPMVLSGLSMGASTVIYALMTNLPENVKGIIADCGFTSPGAILSEVFRKVTKLPPGPAITITSILAGLTAGINLWKYDSVKILSEYKLPILMIHGTADEFVPCKMTERAFAACNGPKRIVLMEGAGHGVSYFADPKKYTSAIQTFLEDTIFLEEKG